MGLGLDAAPDLPIWRRKARRSARWCVIGRAAVGVAVVGRAADEEKTKHTLLFSWVSSILGSLLWGSPGQKPIRETVKCIDEHAL